jgi:hypothetical protein
MLSSAETIALVHAIRRRGTARRHDCANDVRVLPHSRANDLN